MEKICEERDGRIVLDDDEFKSSLPEELWIENILTRLPAPILLSRCSLVSKFWYNSIIKDKRFASIHNLQNRNNPNLILNLLNVFRSGIDRVGIDNVYFFSLEENNEEDNHHHLHRKLITRIETVDMFELVGYCNGLACIKLVSKPDAAMGSISVVSPIRFETLTLYYVTPTGGGYIYMCHGFGFDSLSQVYKAVIVFTSEDIDEFLCIMVITLGTMSWRKITTTTAEISSPPGSPPFPSRMVTRLSSSFCTPATFCGGDLLWRTTCEVGDDSKIEMLLSFDLHNEKVRFIQLPAVSTLTPTVDEHQYLVIDYLLEFKGYPCIARSEKFGISNTDHCGHHCEYQSNFNCCCCCKVHMYVLKDKVNQVWIRGETFDVQIKDQEGLLPAPFCCYFETGAVTPPTRMMTLSDQVLLYWFNGESLIIYNLRKKCLKVVKCSRSCPTIFQTKMKETLGRSIGDDDNIHCPYMDYQLHAQVENLVSLKTFIPKAAKISNYDCIEDLRHALKRNLPAGCVVTGRNPYKCYAFCNDKVGDDEVSDDIEGNLSEKKSGMSIPKRLILSSKAQFMRTIENSIAILEHQIEEEWMAVLKGIPDLDEDLVSDAVDFLRGDSDDALIFLALTGDLRNRWLIRNRPNLLCYPPKPSLHQVSPTYPKKIHT